MKGYFVSKLRLASFFQNFNLAWRLGAVPPPSFVVWDCTRKCNLNCDHCGAKKETYQQELTTDQIKKVIEQIDPKPRNYFTVTGGEPLLRSDLFEVFRFAKKRGLNTGLATNGYLIDKTQAHEIARLFDSVQISLDGTQAVHNKIRGRADSYQRAIAAVKMLQRKKCRQLTLASVITTGNIADIDRLAQEIVALGVKNWKIMTVMPIGRVEENRRLHLNSAEFASLLAVVEKYGSKIRIDFGENLGHLGRYESKLRYDAFYCPVGFTACCIGVDGNVRGCPEEPDTEYFREGNVLNQDLNEIWQKGFRKYRQGELSHNDPHCQQCQYLKSCYGGCWVMKLQNINCSVRQYHLK